MLVCQKALVNLLFKKTATVPSLLLRAMHKTKIYLQIDPAKRQFVQTGLMDGRRRGSTWISVHGILLYIECIWKEIYLVNDFVANTHLWERIVQGNWKK